MFCRYFLLAEPYNHHIVSVYFVNIWNFYFQLCEVSFRIHFQYFHLPKMPPYVGLCLPSGLHLIWLSRDSTDLVPCPLSLSLPNCQFLSTPRHSAWRACLALFQTSQNLHVPIFGFTRFQNYIKVKLYKYTYNHTFTFCWANAGLKTVKLLPLLL